MGPWRPCPGNVCAQTGMDLGPWPFICDLGITASFQQGLSSRTQDPGSRMRPKQEVPPLGSFLAPHWSGYLSIWNFSPILGYPPTQRLVSGGIIAQTSNWIPKKEPERVFETSVVFLPTVTFFRLILEASRALVGFGH